ncbi:MAG: aspartate carbamoyltransferase [Candidatus Saccharimonadales bacterium]
MKNIVSIKQFQDTELLEELFAQAAALKAMDPADYPKPLANKVIATLFYEPSTRTRMSFEAAITRMGGGLVSTENAGQFSSAAKGETLQDTIRTLNGYVDGIVLRHPMLGAAQIAADYSDVPIVNAGDGAGEHPTQALLDLFTIKEAKGQLDGLKIGLVGDLLNGRTIHSLIHLLKMYKADIYCIAPDELQLPKSYQQELAASHDKFHLLSSWDEVLPELDVLYITRIQKERFEDLKTYNRVKDSFVFDGEALKKLNKKAIIMHPLPRVNEITPEVDNDRRALYFEQARNGLFVRMALVAYLCNQE